MTLAEINNKTVHLYPVDYPFETLIERLNQGKLLLNPDFITGEKWSTEKASKFIESCLIRIPLPSCYFAETETNKHIVIDGNQRIIAIKDFFEDKFALSGLSMFEELNGKKFSDLGIFKNKLELYTIRCIVLRKDNPHSFIYEIFARLNENFIHTHEGEMRIKWQTFLNNLLAN